MEVVIGILLCIGTLFFLIASLGIVRMPDLYTRMHAATKAGTVGVASLLLAVAIAIPDATVISRAVGTMLFIFLTASVAAHLLGKAMRKSGYRMWRNPK
ncbi:monovalent cation/H(+) antiporter subunit G [Vibrio sp. EA2]|uniref:monovalent cation/H(+) antiporter subunit G n=1 Tax=Vibrio sp. EA2 TaxID=3079860 RepID=UPI00294931A4|nr:monovalent cation/H(+) antiporter subunit G [Vibrio sp. EA2]MDV6250448.1 monovalent cation/H(+) antiporter subunit G [Vibrio sp. EA2]